MVVDAVAYSAKVTQQPTQEHKTETESNKHPLSQSFSFTTLQDSNIDAKKKVLIRYNKTEKARTEIELIYTERPPDNGYTQCATRTPSQRISPSQKKNYSFLLLIFRNEWKNLRFFQMRSFYYQPFFFLKKVIELK